MEWLFILGLIVLGWRSVNAGKEIKKMSTALEALKAAVAAMDEKDDAIVTLVTDLKTQVEALQAAAAQLDPEIQAAADKLAESLGKFDTILNPQA